jgi:hypothetical protein
VIAVVLGALVLLGGLGVGAGMLFWAAAGPGVDHEAQPAAAADGPERVYTRDEFRKLVMGKTPEGVTAAVGPPDRVQEQSGRPDEPVWHYFKRTKDPVTGSMDGSARVAFKAGKAITVNY